MSKEKKQAMSKTKQKLLRESKTDRISELPDDILAAIIYLVNVRDAAKICTLSRRWRHLFSSKTRLNLNVISLFLPHLDLRVLKESNVGLCRQYKESFVRGVSQILQCYKGSQLRLFRLSFCLEQDSTSYIDQWVSFAASMGVRDLFLNLSCADCFTYDETCLSRKLYTLHSELLSNGNMAKVEHLYLRSCILGPGVAKQFSSLTYLKMENIILSTDEVETILSCYKNLEFLAVSNCTLIPILCIPGSLHRLEGLSITTCSGVEEIELSATNLTRFDYAGDCLKFSFVGAPNLKHVFFSASDGKTVQYVFSQLAKDLPSVETVTIYSIAYLIQYLPEQISTFRKVKKLNLFCQTIIKFDVLKIIAILEACPIIEKLYSVMHLEDSEQEIPGPPMPLECVHKYLKEVHIGGFHFRTSYIEFAISMLEYGVALERLVIDPRLEFRYGFGDWFLHERITWDEGERAKVMRLEDSEQEILGPPMPLERVHKYLKDVHIGGFHFKTSYIEFATSMLEYCVALERLVIDPRLKFQCRFDFWFIYERITWDESERAKVFSRFQDHPKSSVIIIE